MRLPHFKKKFVAGALAAGLVMGAGGIAAAYFTASGSGTGTATVGTPTPFTVTQGAPGPTLYPGGTTTVSFTVKNTASFNEHFTGAHATLLTTGTTIKVAGNKVPGCLAAWFMVGSATPATGTIPAHSSMLVHVKVTMKTVPATQNACAGKTPQITLHV